MKKQMFKILVILLSPIYFMLWVFAKLIEFTIEIGKPIETTMSEQVEKMESFWKEIFKRKNQRNKI